MSIETIVLDGGPCGGKTTGMVHLCEALVRTGTMPVIVPEAATMLMGAGVRPWEVGNDEFQKRILEMQFSHEAIYRRAAADLSKKMNVPVVVLCDRGVMSGAAYLSDENPLDRFIKLFPRSAPSSYELVLREYAGVIHLVTAADGAEQYYTLANNKTRNETVEQARAVDIRTRAVWLGHPKLSVIPNTEAGRVVTFLEKMKRTEAAMWRMLGLPEPVEIEDKYLLSKFSPEELPVPYEVVDIVQMYLSNPDTAIVERVRTRKWRGATSYIHTTKRPRPDGGVWEVERYVSEREFVQLLQRIDTTRRPISKVRHCFLYEDQYFEVDVFGGANSGLVIAEREKTSLNEETRIPEFLDVIADVTHDKRYSNWALAAT